MSVWAPLKLPDSVGGVRVPRRTRETPLTLRLAGLGWLSESLGSAEALSGSVHSQAVFTAANGPREVCVSLRHPTVSMPSRDARSHGTDVPWNGDEEDWPRARDMFHAILRDEFGSDIADTMWYDKVPTDSSLVVRRGQAEDVRPAPQLPSMATGVAGNHDQIPDFRGRPSRTP